MLAVAPEIPPSLETSLTEQRWWNRHGYILPVFLLTMAICAWFVTWGDWNLFDREHFCGFYDAQARSLIAGRLDVPQAAIGTESFTFHGRSMDISESVRRCFGSPWFFCSKIWMAGGVG